MCQLAGKEKWIDFRWITLVYKTLGGAVQQVASRRMLYSVSTVVLKSGSGQVD
jgi:hypothetical protein